MTIIISIAVLLISLTAFLIFLRKAIIPECLQRGPEGQLFFKSFLPLIALTIILIGTLSALLLLDASKAYWSAVTLVLLGGYAKVRLLNLRNDR
ncbi:hypothetical protein HY932_00285 [Candidatus Falkowbacteria bacterium]|nr:hypothetical protein [Candidatus Falkowbacteria bacterium]